MPSPKTMSICRLLVIHCIDHSPRAIDTRAGASFCACCGHCPVRVVVDFLNNLSNVVERFVTTRNSS